MLKKMWRRLPWRNIYVKTCHIHPILLIRIGYRENKVIGSP